MEQRSIAVSIKKVSKRYLHQGREVPVLQEIDLTVPQAAFVSLVGPSGCGKSSLLHLIAGLDEPDEGEIILHGDSKSSRAGKCGYMLQQPLLLPWRTVEENVILGLDVRKTPRKEALEKARDLLKRFGLADFAENYPATLSGGMKQRVALLRTVLFQNELLLLDEPFGALDALTRQTMHLWLQDLWESISASVLLVTHDIREAIFLSDTIYVMSHRPARILQRYDVDLPRPRKIEDLSQEHVIQLEQKIFAQLMEEEKV
ncbi:ABC-type nitrate/sulfonate/bicarbonate transport system ATPase subunit [Thermosporothrix hazakensis]|jgi:ABC-type nitrate/sulfonate/bicarbonate transport system ATPase subunit|uniref:ABC-type nitrate/sulfonate/bicarbonate transport system ATPase subunit n=1 Tax=Thermosporothrix hazakensis TaxID=644383 RepID=A0A326UHT9_THEHA|nr:ABC transporter ATP-binding protein [Thermosporothrix hazakensis]PZW31261.1 ABC-type nitrate/sulfonate/bicarbonate transport system ATPase subunit [Thermosporothrix hazakensis]GCE50825.1 ABC transporter ATP-binding protein [Thermosporothrix hazakensis]